MMFKLMKTWTARDLFKDFIEKHECYDGQISTTVQTFRRTLMIPIINIIKELEKKTDE